MNGTRDAPLVAMMASVKDLVSNFGCASSDLAKRFGGSTADVAKNVGGSAADIARNVGDSAAKLAKKVGPKRGLIGLVAFGAVIAGTVVLVRYLRARQEDDLSEEELALNEQAQAADPHRRRKTTRAQRKAAAERMTH
ncbi:MAG: hypothetical protein JWP01_3787 [Myxococcales bacterium]|nr:hypothetical protein [Myxococcales bacterium]